MRAFGIVRVSQAKGREGDSFASPVEQRERIEDACKRDGIELAEVAEEIDVSGGTPLAERDGLRRAVEAVEASNVEVVMVAYFDRLVRSLRVQDEVVSRVEAAGGRVMAIDFGQVTGKTAAQWLSGTMIGAVSEYYRRSATERTAEGQANAVARGVAPWNNVPPGYLKGDDGVYVPDPEKAPVVAEAFAMRAAGETIEGVRTYLRENGIARSYHGVQSLLTSRVPLGELHFGNLENLSAHEAIVERDIWTAAQRPKRGARPKSNRLLARLGVLRCATCGARMVTGFQTSKGSRYDLYRCPPTGDCPKRVTIGANMIEGHVVEVVRAALADVEGRASAEQGAREAEAEAERAQADLDAAIRAFDGLQDEPVAIARLTDLREKRDAARDHLAGLGDFRSAITVTVEDWDRLNLDERRGLIRATLAEVTVAPGRGLGRVSVKLVGE